MTKKYWAGLALLLTGSSAWAQAEKMYNVEVNCPEWAGKTMYLVSAEEAAVLDSVVLTDGRGTLKGSARIPQMVGLSPERGRRKMAMVFVLDETDTRITRTGTGGQVTGSKENMELAATEQELAGLDAREQQLIAEWRERMAQAGKNIPDSVKQRVADTYEALSRERTDLKKAFVDRHPGTLAGAYYLRSIQPSVETGYVSRALESLSALSDNPLVKNIAQRLEGDLRRTPGTLFTDFSMPDEKGTMHKLSDFVGRGQYVMVDFWASWCGPCRAEMPHVKAAYERFHPKGFEIVGVSLDNNREPWMKATEQLGITWPQLSDLKGWQCEAAALYGVRGIPQTILFGPDGKVIADNLRGEHLMKKLEELYREE